MTSPADLVPVPEAADHLGERLRRRRAPAAPGRRHRPRRAAGPARRRPRLRHRRPARSRCSSSSSGLGRGDLDDGHRVRHGRRAARAACASRSPPTAADRVRPHHPQPAGRLRRLARRRPAPARLHDQRDGRLAARTTSSPTRTAGCADLAAGVLRTPADAARSRSPTTRCGCCGRPGSSPSSGVTPDPRTWSPRCRDRAGDRPDHRRAGAGRADQAPARRRTRDAGWSCSSTPGWPTWSCRSCRRCGWRSTSTTSTRTSTRTR